MKLRILSFITVLCLLLSPLTVGAQSTEHTDEKEILIDSISDSNSNNDELFAAYVEKTLYPDRTVSVFGISAGERLSGAERKLYDYLKSQITAVANGENGSSVFRLDAEEVKKWGLKTTWTNTELGVEYIADEKDIASLFWKQIDVGAVQSALLADCPYEMYWFDKTAGLAWGNSISCSRYSDTEQIASVTIKGLTFVFAVSEGYRSDSYDKTAPTLNTQKTGAASVAKTNAQAIVDRYSSRSDYEKLVAYRDEICSLVSYNDDAADGLLSYGDPWQLIYVFDGNSQTNVVCEGYSKAFQYLCDLSSFEGSILCYTVTGKLDGGAHMWNVVAMDDGGNYLVDVTNSEVGMIGDDGSLFLAGAVGSVASGYTVYPNGEKTVYVYGEDSLSLWDSDVLALRSQSYTLTDSPITVTLPNTFIYDGEAVSAGEANADIIYSCELDGYTLSHAFFKTDGSTATVPKNAGEYVITVKASRTGLMPFTLSKRVVIKKAELTVTPKPIQITQGQTPPDTVECEFDGFVGEDTAADLGGTVKIIHEYTVGGDVGDYSFNISGYVSDNYDIKYTSGTLTVVAAEQSEKPSHSESAGGSLQENAVSTYVETDEDSSDSTEAAASAERGCGIFTYVYPSALLSATLLFCFILSKRKTCK